MMTSHAQVLNRLDVSKDQLLALEGLSASTGAVVFVSGSVVEGMSHRCSDIDVFVVGQVQPSGEHVHLDGDAVMSVHMVDKRRVDFEYWTPPALEALAAKVAALNTSVAAGRGAPLLSRRMDEKELSFIHRIRTGVPLLEPASFERIQTMFDYAKVARYLVELRLRELDGMQADLYGLLGMQDPEFAILRAREFLNTVVDAYLHHLGNTNVKRKWRTRIFDSFRGAPQPDEVHAKFWELQLTDVRPLRSDRAAYDAYLHACIRFANRITNWIV